MAKDTRQLVIELTASSIKLQEDLKKATSHLKKLETDASAISKTISRSLTGAFVALGSYVTIQGIRKLSSELQQLAAAGENAGSIADNFRALGGSTASIDRASAAVQGMVSKFDLMKAANQGVIRGIPDMNRHLGAIAEVAGRVANATGTDATQAIEKLTAALATGRKNALREFGIEGETLTQRLASLHETVEKLPSVTDSLANSFTSLGTTFSDAYSEAGIAINSNEALTATVRQFEEAVRKINWQQVGADIAVVASTLMNLAGTVLPAVTEWFGNLAAILEQAMGQSSRAKVASMRDEIEELKEELADFDNLGNLGNKSQFGPLGQRIFNWFQSDEKRSALEETIKQKERALEEFLTTLREADQAVASSPVTGGGGGAGGVAGGGSLFRYESDGEAERRQERIEKELERQRKLAEDVAKKQREELEKAYEGAVEFWRNTFENAITGVKFDLADALKQVAVGFGAEAAASLFGGLGGPFANAKSPQDFGGAVGKLVFGESGRKGASGLDALTGTFLGRPEGVEGPLLPSGDFFPDFSTKLESLSGELFAGANSFAGYASAAMAAFDDLKNIGKSSAQSVKGLGSGIGAGLGAYFGGPVGAQIGQAIGKGVGKLLSKAFGLGGPTNPDTLARKNIESFLEEKTGRNFVFGPSSRFNDPAKGFGFLNSLDPSARAMFSGLGEGLRATLGIAEDVGPQIGAILAENLSGNIEEAKGLFRELGISAEQMGEAVLQAGIKAGKSWLEIEGQMQQIDKLASPGREGKGDIGGAFAAIVGGDASGLDDIANVIAVAVEAIEAGTKDFGELQQILSQQFAPEQVAIFFEAMDRRGVTSLEGLRDASTRTIGAIIADMQSLGFMFEGLIQNIDAATTAMNNMSGVAPEAPELPQFARGGVVDRATLGVFGEAGPEAIMPLARIGGKLGVRAVPGSAKSMSSVHIHVDARGAAPGVEHRVMSALRSMQQSILSQAVDIVRDEASRGRL